MAHRSTQTRVRPSVSEPVEVQIMGTDFLEIVRARDVGVGGVGIWVPHGFAGCDTSSAVQVVLTLPGRKSFLAEGRIRHRTDQGSGREVFGVQLMHLTDHQIREIKEYIERRTREDARSVLR